MKKIYPLLLICAASTSYAQVGFGTSNPDPNSVIELKATNKGLLMPRIALTSTNLAAPLLTHVKGMTVYNTANAGSGATAVTEGVYYNDGVQWIKMITDAAEPFNVESTTTKATTNTQNIYQNGNIGIGDFSAENPIAKLDVRGAVRGGTGNSGTIGTNSVTFGTGNTASGPNTVATGINNTATGVNAVTMGGGAGTVNNDGGNTSSGDMSFSFGTGNISSGTNSHTMGDINKAIGYASFAGGEGSQSDDYAFAWGSGNRSALAAAAFGYLNFADGYGSFVAGGFNATTTNGALVAGNSNIFRDGSPTTQVATDAAFQLGNSGLDDVGYNGYAATHNAFTVLKNGYTAIGTHTTKPVHTIEVNGDAQIKTLTTGDITTDNIVVADATGVLKTVASSSVGIEPWQIQTTTDKATSNSDNIYQSGSVAIGKNEVLAGAALDVAGALRVGSGHTGTVGGNSAAFGTDVTVSGGNSVGIGNQNTVWSSNTLVVGTSNTAMGTGTANAIFGSNNIQTTEGGGPAYNNNTIFGNTNKITTEGGGGAVQNNTLFGQNNLMTAAGGGSNQANNTIFGQNNTLSAEGSGTTQLNNTLFGNNNRARISANNSTIFGENNISNSYNQFIIGKANTNVDNSLFEIGMGADASNRANALTVIANGNVGIANEAITPTEKLDVGSGNVRVRDINTNTGADTDNIVVADSNGVLKTLAPSMLSKDWKLTGNNIDDTNFLGTNNSENLVFKVGGVQAGLLAFFDGTPTHRRSTSFGVGALNVNNTGYNNTATGFESMASNTTGEENVGDGFFTLHSNTTGSYNTVVGGQTMYSNIVGMQNVALGHTALYHSTGDGNVAVGSGAGSGLSAGDNNIFIGRNATYNVGATNSNQLNIGNWIYGDNGKIGVGAVAASPSERFDVGSGNVRVRDINSNAGATTDNIVVADATGILKTVASSNLAIEPWQVVTTTDKATLNTDNIYQMGNVAIQKNAPTAGVSLDVEGAVRGGTGHTSSVGSNSAAFGSSNEASGDNSVAFGTSNYATTTSASAFGGYNTASGQYSAAFGQSNTSSGFYSVVFGHNNQATTFNAAAFGENTVASGQKATAFGQNSTADGLVATAFGAFTKASGISATAFGNGTQALGTNATTFGNNSVASGDNSTAFGSISTASGEMATTFGYNTFAIGKASTTFGDQTRAPSRLEFSIGGGNAFITAVDPVGWNDADALFQIGNYNSLIGGARTNAMTVLKDGKVGIGGKHTVKPTENLDVMMGNARVRDINTVTGASTDKIVVADATGILKTIASSTVALEPWQIASTTNKATANTDNIYQMGNVGIGVNAPNSTLQIAGSLSANIRTEAGDFTLGSNDYTVVLDAPTTDVVYNATIPTADATNKGRIYHLVLSSSNSLNLTGGSVYQGAYTRTTMYYYQISSLTIQSTGTKWVVLQ